jgi:two-component system response regulator PilR (NtrC family)
MNKPTALVIDDEPAIRELLEITLERMDLEVRSAASLEDGKRALAERDFDLCITDMRLPDGDGLDLVEHIQAAAPAMPVAVITAHGNMEAAIRALKNGAFDFVSKPLDLQVLRTLVHTALRLRQGEGSERRSRDVLLGESRAMRDIRAKIAKLGRSQAPIFVSGESGTGKELVARLIHALSPRAEQPFVAVNCGAIPEELMESEFFGHKKGSFTGAVADKAGLFRSAEGGSLFLDEVADLPLSLQVKLLRAIQEKAIRPVGEAREIPVDVRILSATHKPLADMVRDGRFRQDLFYRINVIEVNVPPLRDRREDIPLLAGHVLDRLAAANRTPRTVLAEDALTAIASYSFPGNVRELENILERATALCENGRIRAEDLGLPAPDSPRAEAEPEGTPLPEPESGISLETYMDEIEKQAIVRALEKTRWNRTAAAKYLGITFRALRYKLKKLGLDD